MSALWKWILGAVLTAVVLLTALFASNWFIPQAGYHMMGNSYGMHMPMMHGGGMMTLVWLVLLGLLVLIVLAIVWFIKALTTPKEPLP